MFFEPIHCSIYFNRFDFRGTFHLLYVLDVAPSLTNDQNDVLFFFKEQESYVRPRIILVGRVRRRAGGACNFSIIVVCVCVCIFIWWIRECLMSLCLLRREFQLPPGFEPVQINNRISSSSDSIITKETLDDDQELWFFRLPKGVRIRM